MPAAFTIIIPTKNRADSVAKLLASIGRLEGLVAALRPEIIVSDNDSHDETAQTLETIAKCFPVALRRIKSQNPGKSAAINEALRIAEGKTLAFLDDDVIVDTQWLVEVEKFCATEKHKAGQGRILLQAPEADDENLQKLLRRYRTIPYVNFKPSTAEVHSLNGANFVIDRKLLQSLGGFDERLGPGASGTSEDVELAQRIHKAGYRIGYMHDAIVHHSINPTRLTEEYFEKVHRRQGASRSLIKGHGSAHIWYDLCRASAGYLFHKSFGDERKSYRNKGRVYHYLGMLEAKRRQKAGR